MDDTTIGDGAVDDIEAQFTDAYRDLARRLGGRAAPSGDPSVDGLRERLSELLSEANGAHGLDGSALATLCQRASLSIPWYDPPEMAVSAPAAPSFALQGEPAAGTVGFHEVELDPIAPLLMLSSDWPTGVPQMPWAVRVLPMAFLDAGDSLADVSRNLAGEPGAAACPYGPLWGLLGRNGDVLWNGRSREGLESFWEDHTLRLEGGWLPVLGMGLAFNYDEGLLVCLDPGNRTYDIADVYDVELPDGAVPTNRAVALSLTADGPSSLADLAACGDTGQTDYDQMVARLGSEPGWVPADAEHLLGEYLRRNPAFAQLAIDSSTAWHVRAAHATVR